MMTSGAPLIGWRFFYGWVLYTVFGCIAGAIIGSIPGIPLHHLVERWPLGEATLLICVGAGVGGMQALVLQNYSVKRSGGWVLATAAGLILGLGLYYWVVGADLGYPVEDVLGPPAFAVAGSLIGLLQWLILRTQVERSVWWVPASAVGWGVCLFAGVAAPILLGIITGGALVWLLRQPLPEA